MRQLFRSRTLWQMAGGFMIGTLGMIAMQPAAGRHALTERATAIVHSAR